MATKMRAKAREEGSSELQSTATFSGSVQKTALESLRRDPNNVVNLVLSYASSTTEIASPGSLRSLLLFSRLTPVAALLAVSFANFRAKQSTISALKGFESQLLSFLSFMSFKSAFSSSYGMGDDHTQLQPPMGDDIERSKDERSMITAWRKLVGGAQRMLAKYPSKQADQQTSTAETLCDWELLCFKEDSDNTFSGKGAAVLVDEITQLIDTCEGLSSEDLDGMIEMLQGSGEGGSADFEVQEWDFCS